MSPLSSSHLITRERTKDPKNATMEGSEGEGNGGEERSEGEGNGALSGGEERGQGRREETYLTESFPMRSAPSTGLTLGTLGTLGTGGGLARAGGTEGQLRSPLTWDGRSPVS